MLILFLGCGEKNENEAPSTPQISFVQDSIFAGEALEIKFDTESKDPDGDSITYQIHWFLNDVEASEYEDSLTISEGIVLGGQRWKVEVVATDGQLQSDMAVAELEISNTPSTIMITGEQESTANSDLAWHIELEDVDRQDIDIQYEILVGSTSLLSESQNHVFPYDGIDVTLSSDNYVKGDEISLNVTVDDSFEISQASFTTKIGNLVPEMNEVVLSSGNVLQPPTVTFSAQDPDGDAIFFEYQWHKNGATFGDIGQIDGQLSSETSDRYEGVIEISSELQKGDIWYVVVTPSDDQSSGASLSSNEVAIDNSIPSILEAQILPEILYADSQATCSVISSEDPDGDSISFDYVWKSNGVEIAQGDSISILDVGLTQGDDLVCEIIPSDDQISGIAFDVTTVISNTIPEVQNVGITVQGGGSGTIEDTLQCNYEIFDLDGDAMTPTISWFQNGSLVEDVFVDTLALDTMLKGDDIYCTVFVNDGTIDSSTLQSESFFIANSIPSIQSVHISPSTVTSADVVSCSYTGFLDADANDADLSLIEWLDSSNVVLATTSAIDIQNIGVSEGALMKCRVTPYDGEEYGAPLLKPFFVQNAPPVVSIELSTDEIFTDSEIFVSVDASDVENDPFVVSIEWEVDGTIVKSTVDYDDVGGVIQLEDYTDSLDGNFYFHKGQDVLVRVTIIQVSDESIYREVVSEPLTVQNSIPPIPNVTIEPKNPFPGETVRCVFDGNEPIDIDGDELTYEVQWYQNDELFEGIGTITTSIVEEGETTITNDILMDGVLQLESQWRCELIVTDIDGGINKGSFSFDICPMGQYEQCAVSSCSTIKDAGYDLKYVDSSEYDVNLDPDPLDNRSINGPNDGLYWLDLEGIGPTQVYCDMNKNEGGWTHLLSAPTDATDFLVNGSGWTAQGSDTAEAELRIYDGSVEDQSIQLPTYGLLETNEIRLCYGGVQQCYIFPHGQNRSLQSFFVEGVTYMDCSKGNELYGIENVNVEGTGSSAFCQDYALYRGSMTSFATFPQSENCYWLGINHLGTDENGNENGTNSAIGLLYSTASSCEYNPTFLGSTYGIGLGLVMHPQNIGPNVPGLWHIFGR